MDRKAIKFLIVDIADTKPTIPYGPGIASVIDDHVPPMIRLAYDFDNSDDFMRQLYMTIGKL